MDANVLRELSTIKEFFKIEDGAELSEATRTLLEAMEEITFEAGQDIVTFGADSDDGMYIILSGKTDVLSSTGDIINSLSVGDFIGELGLINDDKRGATVRATEKTVCANISKPLFEKIADENRKIYGMFMNMLYVKTTKLVTERERSKADLAIAKTIQDSALEHEFTDFNREGSVYVSARMRPAKEVGGDFYDVFWLDDHRLCFLIADVSGKGVSGALFMVMAKTHLRNYALSGFELAEVVSRANDQLCYKNEADMFVTAFICVLDINTGEVKFVNAGHNHPFVLEKDGKFSMLECKANLVLGSMDGIPYREQQFTLEKGQAIYLYTDGITEAINTDKELFGDDRCQDMLNSHLNIAVKEDEFLDSLYVDIDNFAGAEPQFDDMTMLYVHRIV